VKGGRVAVLTATLIALVLLIAEIVRPTTIPPKRLSHPRPAAAGSALGLSQEQIDDLPPIVEPAIGNLDALHAIAGGREVPLVAGRLRSHDQLEISGWCADPEARAAGAGLIAIVDDTKRFDVNAGYGGERLDVARSYGTRAMEPVGFDIRLPAGALGPGVHAIQVSVIARDGRGIFIFPTIAHVAVAP
jgi:hypothetical protein